MLVFRNILRTYLMDDPLLKQACFVKPILHQLSFEIVIPHSSTTDLQQSHVLFQT